MVFPLTVFVPLLLCVDISVSDLRKGEMVFYAFQPQRSLSWHTSTRVINPSVHEFACCSNERFTLPLQNWLVAVRQPSARRESVRTVSISWAFIFVHNMDGGNPSALFLCVCSYLFSFTMSIGANPLPITLYRDPLPSLLQCKVWSVSDFRCLGSSRRCSSATDGDAPLLRYLA